MSAPKVDSEVAFRRSVCASAAYIIDHAEDGNEPWCVEVGFYGDEPAIQGWGPDALSAALDAAANAHVEALRLREHIRGEHVREVGSGPLTCPICRQSFDELLRRALTPESTS